MMRQAVGSVIKALLYARMGQKSPLIVSWKITNACNGECLYCSYRTASPGELSFCQVLDILDQMWAAGIRFISFTGGEPLVREDIGRIIQHAKKQGFFVKLNSNGILLKERFEEVKNVDGIQLSLDGKQAVHEQTRPRGAFNKIIEAIEIAQAYRIPLLLNTVISKYNFDCLQDVLDICKEYKIRSCFQPARLKLLGAEKSDTACLGEREYKDVIRHLISFKKDPKYRKLIFNSLSGLQHLYHWPDPVGISCYAGLITFRVDEHGILCNCDQAPVREDFDISKYGFREAVKRLNRYRCQECWCGSQVESNLIFNFNAEAIINFLQRADSCKEKCGGCP